MFYVVSFEFALEEVAQKQSIGRPKKKLFLVTYYDLILSRIHLSEDIVSQTFVLAKFKKTWHEKIPPAVEIILSNRNLRTPETSSAMQ